MHFKERGRKAAGEREAERQMQQNITVLRGSFAILFAAQRCKPVAKKHFPRKLLRERRKAKKKPPATTFRQTLEKFSRVKSSLGNIHLSAVMMPISEMQL